MDESHIPAVEDVIGIVAWVDVVAIGLVQTASSEVVLQGCSVESRVETCQHATLQGNPVEEERLGVVTARLIDRIVGVQRVEEGDLWDTRTGEKSYVAFEVVVLIVDIAHVEATEKGIVAVDRAVVNRLVWTIAARRADEAAHDRQQPRPAWLETFPARSDSLTRDFRCRGAVDWDHPSLWTAEGPAVFEVAALASYPDAYYGNLDMESHHVRSYCLR